MANTPRTEKKDGYEGTWRRCSRCKGTGEARYNHLNGDTHCYLCDGKGETFHLTAAAKARREADQAWYSAAYQAAYSYKLAARRAMRTAGVAEGERGAMMKALTFWTPLADLA